MIMGRREDTIKHTGVVSAIHPDRVEVDIVSKSACASCHAKGVCGASESQGKSITVKRADDGLFKVGDNVNVAITSSTGMGAVVIAYAIPLLIILVLLLTLSVTISNELVVAGVVIGTLILYFFLLSLFRERLGSKFIFTVEKI